MKCEHCGFSAFKFKYDDHDASCNKKPKPCGFCEKTIPFAEYHAHYELCGSKTQKCDKCGDFVKMMDKAKHNSQNICEQVIARKKIEEEKREEAEQTKRLQEFQREREREIKKQKDAEEKRK